MQLFNMPKTLGRATTSQAVFGGLIYDIPGWTGFQISRNSNLGSTWIQSHSSPWYWQIYLVNVAIFCYGKSPCLLRKRPLFLWSFSSSRCGCLPEGTYKTGWCNMMFWRPTTWLNRIEWTRAFREAFRAGFRGFIAMLKNQRVSLSLYIYMYIYIYPKGYQSYWCTSVCIYIYMHTYTWWWWWWWWWFS